MILLTDWPSFEDNAEYLGILNEGFNIYLFFNYFLYFHVTYVYCKPGNGVRINFYYEKMNDKGY